ncbi:MAG: hypothetical protein ABSF53_17965 [Terracidiphilus sp.]|jgi:hypothetical protein
MKTTKISQVTASKPLSLRKMSLVCLGAALGTMAASAQAPQSSDNIDGPGTSPVAYVYVASDEIMAYSAAPNGQLKPIPGSPFSGNLSYLAGNGKYLFGSTQSSTDIDSYEVESNGALHYVASENVVSADGGNGDADQIFTDHTGETLYDMAYWGNQGSNNTYEEFSIDQSNGKLTFLGIAGDNEEINGRLSFTGNDQFAYSADCYKTYPAIYGFKRSSNGKMTELNINPHMPVASGSDWFCPWLAESDPFGHLAVSMGALDPNLNSVGPNYLATYTVSSSGNVTTTSTTKNMPAVSVGANINAMNASPAGNLLAVAGNGGLQVFHFGANPITHYTGLLTSTEVDQIFWDNDNHLYGISSNANKLWVFTVTPTGYSEAPGSPYSVQSPQGLRVMTLSK